MLLGETFVTCGLQLSSELFNDFDYSDYYSSSNFGYYHSKSIIHAKIHATNPFNSNKYLSNVAITIN